jgi:hypothetical protein
MQQHQILNQARFRPEQPPPHFHPHIGHQYVEPPPKVPFAASPIILKLHTHYPALKQLFEQHPDKLAVHGEALSKLVQGRELDDADTLQIFFYGIDVDDNHTAGDEMVADCIAIIGTLTPPPSIHFSLKIEIADYSVRITKDQRAYEFSSIVRPSITYLTRNPIEHIYDGYSLVTLTKITTNDNCECNYPQTCTEIASKVEAIWRRGTIILYTKLNYEGLALSQENIKTMFYNLRKHPRCEYDRDYAKKAMEFLKIPVDIRTPEQEEYFFAEYASMYRTLNEDQLSNIIYQLDQRMQNTAKRCEKDGFLFWAPATDF